MSDNAPTETAHERLIKDLKVIAGELAALLPLAKNLPGVSPQVILAINMLEAALALVNHALGN